MRRVYASEFACAVCVCAPCASASVWACVVSKCECVVCVRAPFASVCTSCMCVRRVRVCMSYVRVIEYVRRVRVSMCVVCARVSVRRVCALCVRD